jgi:hypothetical protein
MKIVFTKLSHQMHRMEILRADGSRDLAELETPVFLLHDLTHFVVEDMLLYERGFWGMLAAGHALSTLGGKTNPLTEELRFVEKIVGPVQSAYMGRFPADFVATVTAHLGYPLPDGFAEQALKQIAVLDERWGSLLFGQPLELDWRLPA